MLHRATITAASLTMFLFVGGCSTDGDASPAGTGPVPGSVAGEGGGRAERGQVQGLPAGWELMPKGAAQLTASQTPGEVIVRADGEFPSANYEAKLFPSPLRIWPPQYLLARRKTADLGAQVITPFEVTATFKAKDVVRQVVVSDAAGAHQVAVDQARD